MSYQDLREKERFPIRVNLEELDVLVEATEHLYKKRLRKAFKLHVDSRPIEVSKELGQIQQTLQLITLVRNVRTNKVNEAIVESAGIQTSDNIGETALDETESSLE